MQHGKPDSVVGRGDQPEAGDSRIGRYGVAERPVVLRKPGNSSSASGVLKAGFKQFDLFGVIIIAITTGLGGGSLRDMLLDRDVFWIRDQVFFVASLGSAIAVFVAARLMVGSKSKAKGMSLNYRGILISDLEFHRNRRLSRA